MADVTIPGQIPGGAALTGIGARAGFGSSDVTFTRAAPSLGNDGAAQLTGIGASGGYGARSVEATYTPGRPATGNAQVVSFGRTPSCFEARSTIVSFFVAPTADIQVTFGASGRAQVATGELSTQVTRTPLPTGLISVSYSTVPSPNPIGTCPNQSLYIVNPTGTPLQSEVSIVNSAQPGQPPALNAIGNLIGRTVKFIGATNGSTPNTGNVVIIATHTDSRFVFTPTLGTAPTLSDQLQIDIGAVARRSPILEVFLK